MIIDQPEIVFVSKGWGFEKIICNDKYCGKILFFAKGKRNSLLYHKAKDKNLFIHSGKIQLYYSDNIKGASLLVEGVRTARPKEIIDDKQMFAYVSHYINSSRDTEIMKEIILCGGNNFYIPAKRLYQVVALEDTYIYEFSTVSRDDDNYELIKGD